MRVLKSSIDIDFGESIVKSGFLGAFLIPGFEPSGKHAQLASVFEFLDQLGNRSNADGVKKLSDVVLIAVKVEKGS